jgi:hypothetical protein
VTAELLIRRVTSNTSHRYAFESETVSILKPAEIQHVRTGGHRWQAHKKPEAAMPPNGVVSTPETDSSKTERTRQPQENSLGRQRSTHGPERTNADTQTITKCLVKGKVILTDRECPSGSVKSSVMVNTANVGTVAPSMSATEPPQIQHQVVVVNAPVAGTTGSASTRNAECGYLDEQIKLIDALARQALSGQSQDSLISQRKRFRSRQAELHC